MDRQIVYPGAIPLETDLLNTNKNAMIGLAKLAAAILGTSTFLNGLACTPDSPASLNVKVAPGEIYSLQNIDGTAYSSLAADTTHSILKQGIMLDSVLLSCPAPATNGYSINYLVQVAYQDTDANAVVLPYYNASNPSQAYSGPNNSGSQNYTTRKGVCVVSVKAGVAATTGTQTTPAPDAGYTGAYVVTVAYGQTQILAGNISGYSGAPFLPSAGLIVGGLQGNACNISAAGGTADAITGSYTPGISALTNGMTLYVRAASANATATPTFTPNSVTIAAKTIVKGAGASLAVGDIAGAGHWIELQYDAVFDMWVLLNPATGVSSGALKLPVRAATTANIATLAGGAPSTLDGVSLASGDRILVKDQTTASQNGIYVVTTLGTGANGTWSRATDADSVGELFAGMLVAVAEGTVSADSVWELTTNAPITLGTTALSFKRIDVSAAFSGGASVSVTNTTSTVSVSFTAKSSGVLMAIGTGASTLSTASGTGSISVTNATQQSNTNNAQVMGSNNTIFTDTYTGTVAAGASVTASFTITIPSSATIVSSIACVFIPS